MIFIKIEGHSTIKQKKEKEKIAYYLICSFSKEFRHFMVATNDQFRHFMIATNDHVQVVVINSSVIKRDNWCNSCPWEKREKEKLNDSGLSQMLFMGDLCMLITCVEHNTIQTDLMTYLLSRSLESLKMWWMFYISAVMWVYWAVTFFLFLLSFFLRCFRFFFFF